MAKTIVAYADDAGRIYKTPDQADRANDAYAAKDAWDNYLLGSMSNHPEMGLSKLHDGRVFYHQVSQVLQDRKLLEAIFAAVDKVNGRG